MFDEVLDDGIDAVGMQAELQVLKRLKNQGTSIYVISHREDTISHFDNIVNIEMSKGFSHITESPEFQYEVAINGGERK